MDRGLRCQVHVECSWVLLDWVPRLGRGKFPVTTSGPRNLIVTDGQKTRDVGVSTGLDGLTSVVDDAVASRTESERMLYL